MGKRLVHKLSNGMTCIFAEDSTIPRPLIFFNLLVGSGASADPAGRSGLAHVMEHVVSRKLTEINHLFSPALKEAHERRWVVFPSARTELDYTRFSIYAPTELYEDVFEFWLKWFESVPLNAQYVQSCVEEVTQEKQTQLQTNPFSRIYDRLYQTSFVSHPYRWYTVGQIDQLKSINLEECQAFFENEYRPENMYLCCLTSQQPNPIELNRLVEAAEKHLSKLKKFKRDTENQKSPRDPAQAEVRYVEVKDAGQTNFAIGFKIPPLKNLPYESLRVLNQLLLGREAFRRAEMPSKLKVLTGFVPHTRHEGLFEVIGIAKDGHAPKEVAEALLHHFETCLASQFADEHLRLAKLEAISDWQRLWKSVPHRIENMAAFELMGKGSEAWIKQEQTLAEVALNDVLNLGSEILAKSRATIAFAAG